MYYEKLGIAILRPRIYQGKLHTFDAELVKSEGISPQGCHEIGGKWIEDPRGHGCFIEIHDIVDVAIDDIVFGRLFTDVSAPTDYMKTEAYTIKAKRGAVFQFDCGLGTSDLNVNVTSLPPPTEFMEQHYFKNLDMACKKRPGGALPFNIIAKSDKGIAATLFPE